ncbi:MAG: hypothetical protein V4616_14085 [Bacteroidota bacterium]
MRILTLFALLYCSGLYAGPITPEPCWPPASCIPVNKGLVMVIAVGAVIAWKKLVSLQKR